MISAITNSSEFIVSHFRHTAKPMSSLSSADIAAADGNLIVAPVAPRAGFSGRGSRPQSDGGVRSTGEGRVHGGGVRVSETVWLRVSQANTCS